MLLSRNVAAVLLVACTAAVHAQRASVAPEGFLEDVRSLSGASRLGSALLAQDARPKSWGDYCSESQALARAGEFRQAIRAATKALYLGDSQHGGGVPVIYAMNDIATAYNYAGDFTTGQAWADRTLQASDKDPATLGKSDVRQIRANAHRIRATAMGHRGEHEAAVAEIERGLAALPVTGAANARSELELTRAVLLLRGAKIAEATLAAEKLLKDPNPAIRTAAGRAAGEAAMARNDAASARQHFDASLAAAREAKDPHQAVLARLGLARSLRHAGQAEAAGRELQQALSELEGVRRSFHSSEMRSALHGNLQSVFDEAVEFFAAQNDAVRALEASEASRSRAMLDLQGKVQGGSRSPVGEPRKVTEIQARLRGGQRLVVYHQLSSRVIAWTVTPSAVAMHQLPIAATALHAEVDAWRRAIESSQPTAMRQAQALHARLLAPLAIAEGETLVFVPHKSLHLLPFHALHDGRQWLIEKHAVSTALSASLLDVRPYGPAQAALTAVGNPELGKPEWALPGAEQEVQAISALYQKSRVFLRHDASKAQLVRTAADADVVHVAAHAVVDEIDPMYSVIKLASTAGAPAAALSSSDLQARELARMDLSRAQLISLSACSSGVGTVAQGDEFMGFKRAVLAAGARSALLSLWLVDDDATAALMVGFHRAWRTGPRDEALRQAQLAVLRKPGFAHPFFWAPFVLVGDPG